MRKAFDFCELTHDKKCFDFLEKTSIENKNKPNQSYFNQKTLDKISQLRQKLNQLDEH